MRTGESCRPTQIPYRKGLSIRHDRFCTPLDNDFEKGGTALKILIKRAGAMAEAKRNTYRRVYKNDGSGKFHYPKLHDNILGEKGTEYFENEGTEGTSQVSVVDTKG